MCTRLEVIEDAALLGYDALSFGQFFYPRRFERFLLPSCSRSSSLLELYYPENKGVLVNGLRRFGSSSVSSRPHEVYKLLCNGDKRVVSRQHSNNDTA